MFGYRRNARKPKGLLGRIMLTRMNHGTHAMLAEWGLSLVEIARTDVVLDIGCGGGANIARMLTKSDNVKGVDYSATSVAKSSRHNRRAIGRGACAVIAGDVLALPFGDGEFDLVTAFETVYFWHPIERAFSEVYRVLKKGGVFAVFNDTDGESEDWTEVAREVGGMTVYTADRLSELMQGAGFAKVEIHRNGKCIAVIAEK